MAYGKKYVKKTTKYVKKAGPKKASGMSMDIMKLKRQVNHLTKVAINRIQYSDSQTVNTTNALGTDSYQAIPLLKFNNWTRVFGTDADDEVNKQCVIRSTNIPWMFRTSEPDDRRYAVFCVSLKDEASALLLTDGTLDTLVSGTHYNSSQDRTLLNLKYFNVHYYKRFTSGVLPVVKAASGTAGALQNAPNVGIDTQRLGKINIKYGTRGIQVKNPSGDWKAGIYPKDPSKNYFILTFWSGDSSADLEYGQFYFNPLHAVEVSG